MQQQPVNVVVAVHPGLLKSQPEIQAMLARLPSCKMLEPLNPIRGIKLVPKPTRIVIVTASDFWQQNLVNRIISDPEIGEIPRTVIPMDQSSPSENAEAIQALLRIVRRES